jgi:hypothetical protein
MLMAELQKLVRSRKLGNVKEMGWAGVGFTDKECPPPQPKLITSVLLKIPQGHLKCIPQFRFFVSG